jgi:hypothetical protein
MERIAPINKHQIPSTNIQIITKIPMTKTFPSPHPSPRRGEGDSLFENWIFGIIWDLEIGIWNFHGSAVG